MAIRTRAEFFDAWTGIATQELIRASRLVAETSGVHMPANKAVVGANAFAHEAGIHQDGMLKHRGTYEIMTPESIGLDGSSLVIGKHSGRNAVRVRLRQLGRELGDDAFQSLFERFKELADRSKVVHDRELIALADAATGSPPIPLAAVRPGAMGVA